MPTKSYVFYENTSVWIHPFAGDAHKSKTLEVKWGGATTIVSARLYGKIFAAGGTQARIMFNGYDKVWCDATLGDATAEDTVDVMGELVNGSNTVLINIWKVPPILLEKIGYFWATLIIEYEGEEPEVKPWWYDYVVYGAIGGGALLFGVLLALALRR